MGGRAYVEFPEHFTALAAPETVTVTLTPRSAQSRGLAVVDVTTEGVDVVELLQGTGSYQFDYVAYAVRKGFEDYEVYLDKEEVEASSVKMTSALKALKQVQETVGQE